MDGVILTVILESYDKLQNHALNNIYYMASQFIMCFWTPHLAFPD